MKRFLILLSTFCLLISSCIFATGKKEWKQPKLKQGQTIQEAFDELRQHRTTKIEKRRQDIIQERKDHKRLKKASRSQATKDREEEKKVKRAKASESQIDRLDPRKPEFNDLMDLSHENVLLDPSKRS